MLPHDTYLTYGVVAGLWVGLVLLLLFCQNILRKLIYRQESLILAYHLRVACVLLWVSASCQPEHVVINVAHLMVDGNQRGRDDARAKIHLVKDMSPVTPSFSRTLLSNNSIK